MRKLASIQRIKALAHIPNSDTLEVATVLGWKCVVKEGRFKVEDLCIYFEIDSILPRIPEFAFMEKDNYVLKTKRMRGQLAQGLAFPIDILKSLMNESDIVEGTDVTDILHVEKFEEKFPEDMKGKSKGFHPAIVAKPNETRVQSFPGLIDEFMGKRVAVTTKIDGFASSYINDNDEIHVCSHTHSMLEDTNDSYWKMAKKYQLLNILKEVGHLSIQGEVAGPGIIKNRMGLSELDLFIFKIFNNDTQTYFSPTEIIDFCKEYKLRHVPMELDIMFNFTMDELLELAKGKYEPSGHQREGIVIVPMQPCYSEILCGNLSMKVINNDYLLKSK